MKSFLVLFRDKQPELVNDALIKDHVRYLEDLYRDEQLLLCGPYVDNQDAMLVIRAHSIHDAEMLVRSDPFIRTKYYQTFSIHEFQEANPKNNWLGSLINKNEIAGDQ